MGGNTSERSAEDRQKAATAADGGCLDFLDGQAIKDGARETGWGVGQKQINVDEFVPPVGAHHRRRLFRRRRLR